MLRITIRSNYAKSPLQVATYIKGAKITSDTSGEMHFPLNNHGGNRFENMRYTLGTSWPVSKTLKAGTFFRLGQEINVGIPVSFWISGISFNISLQVIP